METLGWEREGGVGAGVLKVGGCILGVGVRGL